MISLSDERFKWVFDEAQSRNVSVQAFLRAVVLPEWHFANNGLRDSSSGRTAARQAVDSGSTPESRTIIVPEEHAQWEENRAVEKRDLQRSK